MAEIELSALGISGRPKVMERCLHCWDQAFRDEKLSYACPSCGRIEDLARMSNRELIEYRKKAHFSRIEHQRIMGEVELRLLQDDPERCLYSTVAGFRCRKPLGHAGGHEVGMPI